MILGWITALSVLAAVLAGIFGGEAGVFALLLRVGGTFLGCWVGLAALAALFLFLVCATVDMEKPREEDSPFFRRLMYPYIEALMWLVLIDLKTAGLEKTPKEGRFLLVCNHQNESDPGVLHHAFRHSQLAFISKKENATMPIVNKFMHMTLCQMIDRENDREALKTILKCIGMIREDKVSVAVFPEGGIKAEHKLTPFRPGVFKIAQKANVPIVVCTLKGTTDLFRNIRKLKRTKVELHLLEVIPAEDLKGRTTVEISDYVHRLVAKDLGPEWILEE